LHEEREQSHFGLSYEMATVKEYLYVFKWFWTKKV